MTIVSNKMESKEKILKYLSQKQELTAGVQNARYQLSVSESNFLKLKTKFKRYFLLMVVVFFIGVPILSSNVTVVGIFGNIWFIGFIGLIYLRFTQGSQSKSIIQNAKLKLENEKSKPDYINGMNDFPNKFYSYWTIDRLINLVKENRAKTLQEAYNIVENQDFQNDQLAIQQENLAVAKSTNTMASISAAANVGTFLNTRRK